MGHQLQRLNASHFAMIDLCLAGHTNKEIAQISGRSPEGVGIIVNSPEFQGELSRQRELANKKRDEASGTGLAAAEKYLQDRALAAAQKLGTLMDAAKDEKVQQTSAINILDRVFKQGSAAGGQVGGVSVVGPAQIFILQAALREDKDEPSETQMVNAEEVAA